jgi:tRNA ligase
MKHEDVLWMFITQMEPLQDDEVDVTVEMSVEDTLEQAVDKAVDGCVRILGVERPSGEDINEALQVAMGYAPTSKKIGDAKEKQTTPRYFGFLPEIDLVDVLGPRLSTLDGNSFWQQLVAKNRMTKRPHVTIVHKNSLPGDSDLWERCMGFHRMQLPPLFRLNLGHVIWNNRIMAVTVDSIEPPNAAGADSGQEFISKLPQHVRSCLHITVGTKDANVPAVEAKGLVQDWTQGVGGKDVRSIDLKDISAMGRIKGLFS